LHVSSWRGVKLDGKLTFVSGEGNVGVLKEMCAEHVGKGVVFFVECEYRTTWSACAGQLSSSDGGRLHAGYEGVCEEYVRVSAASVHFFSPSPSRNSSNLRYN
jgi:hypothetical protein